MYVIAQPSLTLIRGSLDHLLRRWTPERAGVQELFGPPDHPLAAEPTLRRVAQLSWRSLHLTIRSRTPQSELRRADTIILWTRDRNLRLHPFG